MIKKIFISVLIFFISLAGSHKPKDNILASIPFRTIDKKIDLSELSLKDIRLTINRRTIDPVQLSLKKRWISKDTILGRNFILSFRDFYNYGKVISEGLSYFVTEILKKHDSLLIHTPYNVYPVKVTNNKEGIIFNIEKILKKDLKKILKESAPSLKSIKNEIFRLEQHFNSYELNNRNMGAVSYFQFLSKITLDIQFFRNHFLIPDKKKFLKVDEYLGNREGDRYWLYIQNGELYPFNRRLQDVIRKIINFTSMQAVSQSNWRAFIDTGIKSLEEVMLLSKIYPEKKLKQLFTDMNITFFGLIVDSGKTTNSDTSTVMADLENIIRKISTTSGGTTLTKRDIESGLKEIEEHKDTYLDLEYSVSRRPEEKIFDIRYKNEKGTFLHRKKYSKNEFVELIKNLTAEKLVLKLLSVKKNIISFSINSYAIHKKGKFGLLKVLIKILYEKNREVYKSTNTLRAIKKEINISTGFPKNLKGDLILKISILDLISNRLLQTERNIRI
ncbi:MAG: hypothetical protein ABFR75_03495 [Acidobacteriota bacterium]